MTIIAALPLEAAGSRSFKATCCTNKPNFSTVCQYACELLQCDTSTRLGFVEKSPLWVEWTELYQNLEWQWHSQIIGDSTKVCLDFRHVVAAFPNNGKSNANGVENRCKISHFEPPPRCKIERGIGKRLSVIFTRTQHPIFDILFAEGPLGSLGD